MKITAPRILSGVFIAVSLALTGCAHHDNDANTNASANAQSPKQLEGPAAQTDAQVSEQLNQLFADYFEASLQLNPIQGTAIGDPRFNDQLPNFLSEEFRDKTHNFTVEWLDKIRAIDRSRLNSSDRISYDIFIYNGEQGLKGEQFPGWQAPINQFNNMGNFFAQMGSGQSIQPFKTVKDYEDWLARAAKGPMLFDQAIANMRIGMQNGVVQPRVLMEKAVPQLSAHVVDQPEDSIFYQPVANMPDTFSTEDRDRLTAAYTDLISNSIVPAYARLRDFIQNEYLPNTRETVAQSALPDGEDWYNYLIETRTTTELTADEIHQFGLDEVARIRGEMEDVMEEVGFEGSLADWFKYVQDNPDFYYTDEEELLQGYRDLQEKVNRLLPSMFDIAPKADYEVRAVEAFRAQSAAGASYQRGTPDGSRPGVFYVNTYNLKGQPKFGMETLSLHEASPGHHFQISIQQEIEDMPMFRRFGGTTAFAEGWALYAESIGKEMGMFTDPMQYYGRLSDEMLRAMRLVVDTGLHAKGWSREKAIQYMLDNSSMADTDVEAEVERYIAIPGQALAYKIGQRTISELRAKAERELGDKFDIKAFHREVLIDGAVPMEVLRTKINEWIESQK